MEKGRKGSGGRRRREGEGLGAIDHFVIPKPHLSNSHAPIFFQIGPGRVNDRYVILFVAFDGICFGELGAVLQKGGENVGPIVVCRGGRGGDGGCGGCSWGFRLGGVGRWRLRGGSGGFLGGEAEVDVRAGEVVRVELLVYVSGVFALIQICGTEGWRVEEDSEMD